MQSDHQRRELFVALEESLGQGPAGTLMEPLPPAAWVDVARRSDLVAVRGEMAEIRGEMAQLRGELKGEIGVLRGEVGELRSEVRAAGAPVHRGQHPDHVRRRGAGPGRRQTGVSEFLIITGMSGAGRSQAADTFEDLGLVRDRQPAAGAHRQGGRAGPGAGSTAERVALVVGTGHYLDELTPPSTALRATGAPGPDPVPRRDRRGAHPPLREHPPPPSAGRARTGHRRHRAGAGPARPGEGARPTSSSTPATSTSTSSATACSSCSAATAETRHADERGVVRVQARAAARRRPGLRLPLPAQPPLGRRAAPPHRPRRAGARLRGSASPRRPSSWPSSTTCSPCSCRPTSRRASRTCRSPSAARAATTGRSYIAEELAKLLAARGFQPMVSHRDLGQ